MQALDLIIFSPEIYITVRSIALLIQSTIITKRKYSFFSQGLFRTFVINPIPCITAISLILSIYYFIIQIPGLQYFRVLSGAYSNPATFYVRLVLAFLFILYLIHLRTNMHTLALYSYEFYIILFFAFIALNLVLISSNFLNIFLFIEIYSMCVYYLIGSKKNSVRSMESTIKYFIFGSFSSAVLLFGMFLIYYSTGRIELHEISSLTFQNAYFQNYTLYVIGAYMVCFSLLVKIGASIFSFWIVEIYDGISFNMLIFLNIFPKIVYTITLLNIESSFNLSHLSFLVRSFLLSSLLIGLLGAIGSTKTKRFLVFTSIYNVAFFSIPFWGLNNEMIGVLIFFFSVYLLNFPIFMMLFSNLKDMRSGLISKDLIDLHELKVQNPRLAWLFIILTFFASGLPMTAVFLSKFSFFFDLSRLEYVPILAYFLLLSGLSFFYYIRIIKIILRGTELPNILFQPVSLVSSLMYAYVVSFNILIFFFYDELTLLLNLLMDYNKYL